MKQLVIALSLIWPLICSGCAIVSQRTFGQGFELSKENPDVSLYMTMSSRGVLGLLNETWIELPPLLHLEYSRGPFQPKLRVVNRNGKYAEMKLDCLVVRYKNRPQIDVTKQRSYPLEADQNGKRTASVILPVRVYRHEEVEIWCWGRFIQTDGTVQEFESCHRFYPDKVECIGDWFSWCASC